MHCISRNHRTGTYKTNGYVLIQIQPPKFNKINIQEISCLSPSRYESPIRAPLLCPPLLGTLNELMTIQTRYITLCSTRIQDGSFVHLSSGPLGGCRRSSRCRSICAMSV